MARASRMNAHAAVAALSLFASVYAQNTVSKPGQPSRSDAPLGQFEVVGDSIASAQQVRTAVLRGTREIHIARVAAIPRNNRQGLHRRQGGEQSDKDQRSPRMGSRSVYADMNRA